WSGGNLERPAMTRLRTLVRAGKVDCVVVFKLDRLSRSVIDMVNLVLEEWDGLTHVKSAREPLDTSSAMGKQFFYMLVSFAEWERSVIRERTTAGRMARAREGYKPSSKAPYGYRHGQTKGAYEIDPAEAPLVQKIFELYNRGLGAKGIVVELNGQGFRNRNGEMWNQRTIIGMLSNPVYTGKMIYGRITRNPRHGKVAGETYWVKNESATVVEKSPFIPQLIADDVFAMTQQVKASRRCKGVQGASPRATASPYLVTGLAKCKCGYSLYTKWEKCNGRQYQYYCCLGKKIKGKLFCDAGNIPAGILEDRVREELVSRYGSQLARERYREAVVAGLERSKTEVSFAVTGLDQRIAKLENQERQVRSDYREQLITASEFRALRKDLADDLHKVREQRQQLLAQRVELEEQEQALSLRLQAVEQMDKFSELSPQEQKNLLRCFVESLTTWATSGRNKEIHLQMTWHWANAEEAAAD
ncbi:MAG: recombinase family protein, partial [Actinomycetota bacterium]